jgi:hypothetical protein
MGSKISKITVKNDSFTLDGVQWHIEDDVTIGRLPELEKMLHHFINGVELTEQQLILKAAYDDLNEVKVVDAGRKLYNLLNATIIKNATSINPKLLIATMFINREGEDLTKWDVALAESKIKQWSKYTGGFFFELADRLSSGILIKIYGISEAYSKAMIKVGESRVVDVTAKKQKRGTKSKKE